MTSLRVALAFVALGFFSGRSCGFTPDDGKGEGEPCTRSSECQTFLVCRAGVCATESDFDAGWPPYDAGGPFDAGPVDAGRLDAGRLDAGGPRDGGSDDGGRPSDAAVDGASSDGATPDAAPSDGGFSDAMTPDASPSRDGG